MVVIFGIAGVPQEDLMVPDPRSSPPRTPAPADGAGIRPSSPHSAAARRQIAERDRFLADLGDLELRLAIIDDRFERLASRPAAMFRSFRDDTVNRVRAIASRAAQLERRGVLTPQHRSRAAALCIALKHRVGCLDARHAQHHPRSAGMRATTAPSAP
ncbi:hypothetical protein BJ978_001556 [Agromyces terreus]|uniref:Uncharacterized protein n=1 Tax=Agromyces terreus TaxID=424795 RepID=A0A9X2H1G0_9MICO|nr:hypothetical protein [Agromyces terreus]MCP2370880.1 hypothetical protein [Agromyces terreus]